MVKFLTPAETRREICLEFDFSKMFDLKSLQSYEIQKIKLLWTQFQDSRSQDIIHNQSTYFRKKCWLTVR